MNKRDFLSRLNVLLGAMPAEERKEVLYDYEEHFRMGMQEGKTEEEIARDLGDVYAIARQYHASFKVVRAETNASAGNIVRAVLATAGLGFFNLVFILGPFMGLVGVLIGLFAAGFGITIGGIGILIGILLAPLFPSYINIGVSYPVVIFGSVGLSCLGLLFLIGDFYLAKFFYKGTVRYLKWNIDVITRK